MRTNKKPNGEAKWVSVCMSWSVCVCIWKNRCQTPCDNDNVDARQLHSVKQKARGKVSDASVAAVYFTVRQSWSFALSVYVCVSECVGGWLQLKFEIRIGALASWTATDKSGNEIWNLKIANFSIIFNHFVAVVRFLYFVAASVGNAFLGQPTQKFFFFYFCAKTKATCVRLCVCVCELFMYSGI